MTLTPRKQEVSDKSKWLPPADKLVADQAGEFYKLSDVARIVGKSATTIRRLMRGNRVKAPSYEVRQGDMVVYLFTPDDIEEIRRYYGSQKPQKR
jgi:hypothetical protein